MQKISGNNTRDADSPIKLETISDWPTKGMSIHDIAPIFSFMIKRDTALADS